MAPPSRAAGGSACDHRQISHEKYDYPSYHEAGNKDRIWEVAIDLLEANGFDVDLAAAALLGRDARRITRPATCDAVVPLLELGKDFETLARDMLAGAARRMFADGFADTTDNSLAVFRDGFMETPTGSRPAEPPRG